MSQAEDKLENNRLKYIDYTFKRHGVDPESKEGQLIYYAYGHGYHQAEKDLELTWKDMRELHIIFAEVDVEIEFGEIDVKADTVGYYKEVLKRFNEMKRNQ